MTEKISSLQKELESHLKDFVISGAEHALRDIIRFEMDDLALRDPAFSEVAARAKELLVHLAELVEEGLELKVLERVKEYAEILDSISQSIMDRNNRLLTDCISHMQEFVEINGKGE